MPRKERPIIAQRKGNTNHRDSPLPSCPRSLAPPLRDLALSLAPPSPAPRRLQRSSRILPRSSLMWSRCSAAAPTPATRSLAPRMVDPDVHSFAPILRSIPAITLARASSNHVIYDASLTSRAPLPTRDPASNHACTSPSRDPSLRARPRQ